MKLYATAAFVQHANGVHLVARAEVAASKEEAERKTREALEAQYERAHVQVTSQEVDFELGLGARRNLPVIVVEEKEGK
jgi:hypothetical protein